MVSDQPDLPAALHRAELNVRVVPEPPDPGPAADPVHGGGSLNRALAARRRPPPGGRFRGGAGLCRRPARAPHRLGPPGDRRNPQPVEVLPRRPRRRRQHHADRPRGVAESSVRTGDPVRQDDRLGAASSAVGCRGPGARRATRRPSRRRLAVRSAVRDPARYGSGDRVPAGPRACGAGALPSAWRCSAAMARASPCSPMGSPKPYRCGHTTATRHSWCRVAVCMPYGWRVPSAAGPDLLRVGGRVAQRLAVAFLAGAFLAAVVVLAGVVFLAGVVVLAAVVFLAAVVLAAVVFLTAPSWPQEPWSPAPWSRRGLLRGRGLGRSRLGRGCLRRRLLGRRCSLGGHRLGGGCLDGRGLGGGLGGCRLGGGAAAALVAVFLAAFGTFLAPETYAFRSVPARNRGMAVALARLRSPVRGLRTIRAERLHLLEDTEAGDGHLLTGGGLVGDRLGDGIEGAGRLRLVAVEMGRQHLDELSLVHGFPSLGRMSAAVTYACTGPR